MEAKILDGGSIRDMILLEVTKKIESYKSEYEGRPGIAFLSFVDHIPLMKYTIALHVETAKSLGFAVLLKTCPAKSEEDDMIEMIQKLNEDRSIHAIVLLQPVPKHINALNLIKQISKEKEIEGFHPLNAMDTLTQGLFNTRYPMCLPAALFELFSAYQMQMERGQEIVFAVDEDFIANPFRSLVMRVAASQAIRPDCSTTYVSLTHKNARDIIKRADYLFVISENPDTIDPDWLKKGVCVIDIYSNLINEIPSKRDPRTMIPIIRGGVNVDRVQKVSGAIAPCPGGLMPVLLAVLFRNAILAYEYAMEEELISV